MSTVYKQVISEPKSIRITYPSTTLSGLISISLLLRIAVKKWHGVVHFQLSSTQSTVVTAQLHKTLVKQCTTPQRTSTTCPACQTHPSGPTKKLPCSPVAIPTYSCLTHEHDTELQHHTSNVANSCATSNAGKDQPLLPLCNPQLERVLLFWHVVYSSAARFWHHCRPEAEGLRYAARVFGCCLQQVRCTNKQGGKDKTSMPMRTRALVVQFVSSRQIYALA